MCETCGCGNNKGFTISKPDGTIASGKMMEHLHTHENGVTHSHPHEHSTAHGHEHGSHSHNDTPAGKKLIGLNLDILAENNIIAAMNRRFFEGRKVLCINMVSSPGSGKTTILEKTISTIIKKLKVYVIEGDQQTLIDARRIENAGAPAVQINTGSGCHLDAAMISEALENIDPDTDSVLFIENVGNLVCPAMFDLGETKRVLIASVTEGEDKPLKYPLMFETSHLCIISKSDLAQYTGFRKDEFKSNAKAINPSLEFLELSAKTGDGMESWYEWLLNLKNT